ncbi:MAG: glycosyltransferase, partial [Flavobacteriia bacterium]|nr:glycosyltransferase [Flavobacteriia bacterium]
MEHDDAVISSIFQYTMLLYKNIPDDLKRMMEICLNMIVKNESNTIERCLDTASWLFTRFLIHDTGSTDDTVEKIRSWGQRHSIPGEVQSLAFKDFGYNRTAALKAALRYLTREEVSVDTSFILFIDADMLLHKGNNWSEGDMMPENGDVFQVIQKSTALAYTNIRLIRVRTAATSIYKCVTHEYLAIGDSSARSMILPESIMWIEDVGDGGSKTDKFERDKKLLLSALETDPNDPRTLFYLANTYKDLTEYDQAIRMYDRRIKVGGWAEEVFMSYLSRGDMQLHINDIPGMIFSWLMALET